MRDIPRETIEKAASGDMDAFEEIYKAFSSMVYSISFNITHNRQDAEEATQDVFIKIFKKLKDFKFESSFGTWAYRITMNTAINIYKTSTRRKQNTGNYEDADKISGYAATTDNAAPEQERAGSQVASMLAELSPQRRSCIVLRELEELDYKEIAEILRIPLNTVRSRIKRAREALVACSRKGGVRHGL